MAAAPTSTGRVATGYHGTNNAAAAAIIRVGFRQSSKAEDWLGDGAYFFQDAPRRAWEWAEERFKADAAVIEANIELKDFIDLLDTKWSSWLATVHDEFVRLQKASGASLPIQRGGAHRLDRAVLNFAVDVLENDGQTVRGIRGAFQEGFPVFPNSALFSLSHVQIAVRDLSLISECRMITELEAKS
jgi:hypothetical protein